MYPSGWLSIDEAAALLGLERSGVYRKAKRGDFGPIQTIGGTQRPLVILVKASAVTAITRQRADLAALRHAAAKARGKQAS